MTWRTALEDPVFLTFFWILSGLLVGGGVLLFVIRLATGKKLDHACRSYVGWLIMVPIFLGAVFLGRTTTMALFLLLALMGFKEFARGTGLYRDWWMTGVVYLGIVTVATCCWMDEPEFHRKGWLGMFLALPAFAIALIITVPILLDRTKGQLQLMALASIGFIYIGWMFGHLSFLANSPNAYGYVMYLVLAVQVN
ncbi:MAG: hypothetical protein CMJ83_09340 [Planctomycetes bacterium]|nr:hypothetical protein [Planctomycetota bacterium]